MSRSKLLTMLVLGAAVWPAGAQAIPDPGIEVQAPTQDLRSPDARDAAGVGAEARAQSPNDAPPITPEPTASDGFEWGDAGIGAAVVLGVGTLAGGTLLLTTRSRQRTPSA
jgi:uncharacterized membrane protein